VTDLEFTQAAMAELRIDAPGLHAVGPVHAFRAEPAQMLPLWGRLRAAHDRTGLWPLLLGPDPDMTDRGFQSGGDPQAEVARGLTMDTPARLAELRASWLEDGDDPDIPPRGPADGLRPQSADEFHLAGQPGWIGLVASDAGFTVPGLLLWAGSCNYDAEPADHVAVLKHWHERYGAELVGLGLDVIELRVPHPPADRAAALSVAEDQYWYCPDLVDQGLETLDALAAVQVAAKRWFLLVGLTA
jgi:hypothetical protein